MLLFFDKGYTISSNELGGIDSEGCGLKAGSEMTM